MLGGNGPAFHPLPTPIFVFLISAACAFVLDLNQQNFGSSAYPSS